MTPSEADQHLIAHVLPQARIALGLQPALSCGQVLEYLLAEKGLVYSDDTNEPKLTEQPAAATRVAAWLQAGAKADGVEGGRGDGAVRPEVDGEQASL